MIDSHWRINERLALIFLLAAPDQEQLSLVITYALGNYNASLFATVGIASEWRRDVTSGGYKAWIDKNYAYRSAV
jgi:hypothetical protein